MDRCEIKKLQSSYVSSLATVVYSPIVSLCETNFPYEGGHVIAHLISKTYAAKERPRRSVFKHKHVVEEAKMLIKLIVVNSYHFIRYNCKITHYLGSQKLSSISQVYIKYIYIYIKYISTIILDDNEKLAINKELVVLIGVGTFTSTSSFDTQSLQFVTMK